MPGTESAPAALDAAAYERLRDAAETHREELVVRLGGEAGLRPAEIAALTPSDVTEHAHDGDTHHLATVAAGDAERHAYLPPDLAADLTAYVEDAGRDPHEPVFPVSARRIQMLVSDVTDRAADAADRPALAAVSARDLRRYYAHTLLVADGVDPRVVKAVGGWQQLDTVVAPLDDPDPAAIVAEFATRTDGTAPDAPGDDRLRAVLDALPALGTALANVSTREEIEDAACEALIAVYDHVWLADERTSGLSVVAAAGLPDDARELPAGVQDAASAAYDASEPVVRAPTGSGPIAESPAVGTVPVRHGDTTYGVLGVGVPLAPDDVTDPEIRLLVDVGRRLGQAIAAVERRRLLLADTVIQLTLATRDANSFFVRLSNDLGCSLSLTGLVPGEDGALLAFVWLDGTAPDDVFERATHARGVESARLIRTADDDALVEFVLTDASPVLTLVEQGGSLTDLEAEDGTVTMTAEFVPDVDVRDVIEAVQADFPATDMVAKREVERSVQTGTEFGSALDDALTPKQHSALQAAYHAGYFDWPRGSTAEELADSLGVTSPTFHNHLRRAQQKLLATFLEELDADAPRSD